MVYGYVECVQMLIAFLYCVGTCMVVYFDQVYLTIYHVDCKWTLLLNARSQRCDEC